jgi:predicted amino acid racemase
MSSLRLMVDLKKITFNARRTVDMCRPIGLEVIGVTKGVSGHPLVAEAMLAGGIEILGDSRLDNIARMRKAGIDGPFVLIRSPGPSEVARTVELAHASLNSSLEIIAALSREAMAKGKHHGVILMVDLETGREGLPVHDVPGACRSIAKMPGVELRGLGAYFHFKSETSFQAARLNDLVLLADKIKREYGISPALISGGSTNVFRTVVLDKKPISGITQLRIGTAVLLGLSASIGPIAIEGFYRDTFVLDAEVIELKASERSTAILSLGKLDADPEFLFPFDPGMRVLDATSDHLLLHLGDAKEIRLGSRIAFLLGYPALSRLMASPHVTLEWR